MKKRAIRADGQAAAGRCLLTNLGSLPSMSDTLIQTTLSLCHKNICSSEYSLSGVGTPRLADRVSCSLSAAYHPFAGAH